MKKIVVVGGGASGMMAAIVAAKNGNNVVLIEKNEKLGKKIYITGKGRCNITNTCDTVNFFDSIFVGKEFSYSAIYGFDQFRLIEFFREAGLEIKIERGNRAFPISDKASDVTKALKLLLDQHKVQIMLNSEVKELMIENNQIYGIKTDSANMIHTDCVILCCGGKSYPLTGSNGSGYILAKQAGHRIVEPVPALVALLSNEAWVKRLAGLSLKNVDVSLYIGDQLIASKFGEMLFTHKGLSGPTILSLSCLSQDYQDAYIRIDLKPALDETTLDKRVLRDFQKQSNKNFKNSLDKLCPKSLAQEIVAMSGIDPEKKINQITSKERARIVFLLKNLQVSITDTAQFNEAIITNGGVDTLEIDPSTMMSKKIDGLYFSGEMINVHGYTGGYNLQLAFSTGYLAGNSVNV